jgi:hypothetical protein
MVIYKVIERTSSLPLISILAFTVSWCQHHDLAVISMFAKETLILMVLGLPLFLPLIFASNLTLDSGHRSALESY